MPTVDDHAGLVGLLVHLLAKPLPSREHSHLYLAGRPEQAASPTLIDLGARPVHPALRVATLSPPAFAGTWAVAAVALVPKVESAVLIPTARFVGPAHALAAAVNSDGLQVVLDLDLAEGVTVARVWTSRAHQPTMSGGLVEAMSRLTGARHSPEVRFSVPEVYAAWWMHRVATADSRRGLRRALRDSCATTGPGIPVPFAPHRNTTATDEVNLWDWVTLSNMIRPDGRDESQWLLAPDVVRFAAGNLLGNLLGDRLPRIEESLARIRLEHSNLTIRAARKALVDSGWPQMSSALPADVLLAADRMGERKVAPSGTVTVPRV